MNTRRLVAAYVAIAATALSIGVARSYVYMPLLADAEPAVHDASSLPDHTHACGRRWNRGDAELPYKWRDLLETYRSQPVVVYPGIFTACPAAACTAVGRNLPCHTVIFARIGEDTYVSYSLSGGP